METKHRETEKNLTGSKSGRPKVSICIPAYNNPEEVRRLLLSIVQQTFRDVEIILTDDSTNGEIEELVRSIREGAGAEPGSLEGSAALSIGTEISRPAPETAARLHYVHNEKPLGHIFNWNRALELAGGEYIKIMFSDDWFTFPDSLEKMVSLLDAAPEASLAFCGTMQVSEKRSYARAAEPEYTDRLRADWRNLFLGNKIGAPSATLYRECGARFDEKSNWASDMFLYFEILKQNPGFVCTDEPLISIGIHEEQYTGTFTEKDVRKYQDSLLMYRKYGLKESGSCKKEMLHLTVMYGQGWRTAQDCGASFGEYAGERVRWFWHNTVLGYWHGLLHKLGLEKQTRR